MTANKLTLSAGSSVNWSNTVPLCNKCNEQHLSSPSCLAPTTSQFHEMSGGLGVGGVTTALQGQQDERARDAMGTSCSTENHDHRHHPAAPIVIDEAGTEAETELESDTEYHAQFTHFCRGPRARVTASMSPVSGSHVSESEQDMGQVPVMTPSTDTIPSSTAATQGSARTNRNRATASRASRCRQRNIPPFRTVAHRTRSRTQGVPGRTALWSGARSRRLATPDFPFAASGRGQGCGDGQAQAQGNYQEPYALPADIEPGSRSCTEARQTVVDPFFNVFALRQSPPGSGDTDINSLHNTRTPGLSHSLPNLSTPPRRRFTHQIIATVSVTAATTITARITHTLTHRVLPSTMSLAIHNALPLHLPTPAIFTHPSPGTHSIHTHA
ncbi:hypothetical protein BDW69DRAFT_187218 [Aspergillus filifer]